MPQFKLSTSLPPYSVIVGCTLQTLRIEEHFFPQRRCNLLELARRLAELEKLPQIVVRIVIRVVAGGTVPTLKISSMNFMEA
jgi:hypothetical protein